MPVTAVGDVPGFPPGGETSLVVIDDVEYLRIVLPTGEVRYEQTHATPTPDAAGGSGTPASDLPYDPVLWDGNLNAATKNVLRDKFEALVLGSGGGATISAATDYIGGGPTKLDGESTTVVTVPQIYNFKHSTTGWRQYLLRAGTDTEASPNIIRPDDYAASTNEKVFELMF